MDVDNDRSIDRYSQALLLNPRNAMAYYGRGTLLLNANSFDMAIADFNQAIQLNPSFAEAYGNRAIAEGAKLEWDRSLAMQTRHFN